MIFLQVFRVRDVKHSFIFSSIYLSEKPFTHKNSSIWLLWNQWWERSRLVPRDIDMKVTLDSYSVKLYLFEIFDSKNLQNKWMSSF